MHRPWDTKLHPATACLHSELATIFKKQSILGKKLHSSQLIFSAKEGISEGFAGLHVGTDGKILGATIVGPSAGDHISEARVALFSTK